MSRASLVDLYRQNRRDALDARDRFYREAAGGEVPRGLRVDLAASVMKLRDVVREFQPHDRRDELPDVSAARSGPAADPADLVELIDELDALARKYGGGSL